MAPAEDERKAENIRRAAPVLNALVENYQRRQAQERAASSPARSASPVSGRGDFSEDAA